MQRLARAAILSIGLAIPGPAGAEYLNFESSHVHPIALTPSGSRLLAVNTPDSLLEVFAVATDGGLHPLDSIPVGLEPVTVVARSETEAWVVNHLSDSVSIVNLTSGVVVRTLVVGDEPTDAVFAAGKAFVAVSQEDAVKVFDLNLLDDPPIVIDLFGSDPRALAVSHDGSKVYAVVLHSGNRTTVVNANIIEANDVGLVPGRLTELGLNDMACHEPPARPPRPPLPPGIARDPGLTDPAPPAKPPVGLIVGWDEGTGKWLDEATGNWTNCLPFRLPDHDLFVIDAAAPGPPSFVDHIGTSLFEVSVNPDSGLIYVPNTEARNLTRFEHPLGVQGHVVDNRLSVVDPNDGSVTILDLNTHINRSSDPAANLSERLASISQPGMMVWNDAGTTSYMTAIGSRKLFKMDGSCTMGSCLFGPDRSNPWAVEVGEGPTGVALHEGRNRIYVLNRISHSIATVDALSMTRLDELPLHDPSHPLTRDGRRFLYDAIDTSGHGDAACASCHISGDRDELAWDLGNPEGEFVPYGLPDDNVRVHPVDNLALLAHDGFDPEKGPMTTQTLRGMLEPLHWRGDRPTMNAFNGAFVNLMGTENIGTVSSPAGLDPNDMGLFRQFALRIAFPPNPYRNIDDTLPDETVTIKGSVTAGNPTAGETIFNTGQTDGGFACVACHQHPFGAAGGALGGVEPEDPASARAALFNGNLDGSPHSDLKVPHLRNMYEKFGPVFASHGDPNDPPSNQKTGFGYTHDGSIPNLETFLSLGVFTVTPQQVRDLVSFQLHFPTGIRPSVGRQVTLPAGAPGDPNSEPEILLGKLIALGNAADQNRHCELVAAAPDEDRTRTYYLNGGIGTGGLWTTDVGGEQPIPTLTLRQNASGPITVLCTPIGSGVRQGHDRDGDGTPNGDDCDDSDAAFFASPDEVSNVTAGTASPFLSWDDQAGSIGSGERCDVVGGTLSGLRASGLAVSTSCIAGYLTAAEFDETAPDPPPGDGRYYLIRARTAECPGGFGPGREALETLVCPVP